MYDALGLRFTVSCPDESTRAYVAQLLSGLVASAVDDGELVELPIEDETLFPDRMAGLVGLINQRSLEAASGSLLLHAGAVSVLDLGATILAGPSGSGKSTLTAALACRHPYITDEIVCLDPHTTRLTPFRKPLSLKRGAHALFPHVAPQPGSTAERYAQDKWFIPADALGSPPLPDAPILPNVVVFPTHVAGAATRVERLTLAESTYRLGSNATQLSAVRGGGVAALARLARRVPAFALTYGDLEEAVSTVEDLSSAAA